MSYVVGRANMDSISIHAPTRGAMVVVDEHRVDRVISIHAPTRGAIVTAPVFATVFLFQSTHLHEVR